MFDLEQSIAEWRKQMLAAGIRMPVPLEELESHLRDEIERQMQSGLNPEKAFESAAEKIGQVHALKTEFAKMSGIEKSGKRERKLISVSLVTILSLVIYGLFRYEMSLTWRLLGFADFAGIALSVLGWRRINQSFPVIPYKRIRTAIGLSFGLVGVIGMIVFMNFILPHFEFTEGQIAVVVLWGLTVMAAFGVVFAGLEEAARRQNTTV